MSAKYAMLPVQNRIDIVGKLTNMHPKVDKPENRAPILWGICPRDQKEKIIVNISGSSFDYIS